MNFVVCNVKKNFYILRSSKKIENHCSKVLCCDFYVPLNLMLERNENTSLIDFQNLVFKR